MPLPKTVTAQDFLAAIHGYEKCSKYIFSTYTLEAFDALLSRARQEERHEYAKEVRGFMNASLEVAKESEIQRARQEARREALKEMDEAWRSLNVPKKLRDSFKAPVTDKLYSLRKEYNA